MSIATDSRSGGNEVFISVDSLLGSRGRSPHRRNIKVARLWSRRCRATHLARNAPGLGKIFSASVLLPHPDAVEERAGAEGVGVGETCCVRLADDVAGQ